MKKTLLSFVVLSCIYGIAQNTAKNPPKITNAEQQLILTQLENKILTAMVTIQQQQAIEQGSQAVLQQKEKELCGRPNSLFKAESGNWDCKPEGQANPKEKENAQKPEPPK